MFVSIYKVSSFVLPGVCSASLSGLSLAGAMGISNRTVVVREKNFFIPMHAYLIPRR